MPSDLLQSFIVLIAAISAMLVASVLARAMARQRAAEAPEIPPAAPPTSVSALGPPAPQEVVLAQSPTPMRPIDGDRPTRRLNLAAARKGIVLAAIIGPCWDQSPDQGHRP